MDKIKENGFVIGVAVLAVLLLVFLYVWTLQPLFGELPEVQQRLERANTQIERFARKGVVKPSQALVDAMQDNQVKLESALQRAIDFYQAKDARFKEYLPGLSENSDPGTFNVALGTEIDRTLREKYVGEFGLTPSEDEKDRAPNEQIFTVHRVNVTNRDEVALGMKQYWIISEIFRALHAQKVPGLKAIRFPTPKRDDLPTPTTYEAIRAQIELEVKPSKLTPFVVELFNSEQVPFADLEMAIIQKDPKTLQEKMIHEKTYTRVSEAQQDENAFHGLEEPKVSVTLRVVAMNWKGLPDPKATEG